VTDALTISTENHNEHSENAFYNIVEYHKVSLFRSDIFVGCHGHILHAIRGFF
jgi:hypothetical protein